MGVVYKQEISSPTEERLDRLDNLIILLPEAAAAGPWPGFAHAPLLKGRIDRRGTKIGDKTFTTMLPNDNGTHVTITIAKTQASAFERLTQARKIVAGHLETNPQTIAIYLPGVAEDVAACCAEALVAALLAGLYALPSFKSTPAPAKRLKSIHVLGLARKLDLRRTYAEADGNNLARHLTALPANELTPGKYRERITALATEHRWQSRFYNKKALQKHHAGAFLAVTQGSARDDAGIMHLRYVPAGKSKRSPLALVGKGICFDTGGTNIKSSKHMLGMHTDMEGSAVALGTLLALTQIKVDFAVDCWLALADNSIGPNAYRQNDVVTAANGTTIEIIHTDAEGRMVLADTLALASREKPGFIIDYATLTGACVYALGTYYSGAFSNRNALAAAVTQAGADSGERVWPFPMDADYDEELESEVADIKQCTIGGEADHILAARFLGRFVGNDIPWLHLDLSAGVRKGGLAHIPSEVTGFGTRFTLNLILDQPLTGIWK